jgi:hypothetical protein
MHSQSTVAQVLSLREQGLGARRIAKQTALPVATVRDWLAGKLPQHSRQLYPHLPPSPSCPACAHPAHAFSELPPEYVYLLGLYLGDGCISAHRRGVYRLRVFLDLRYPEIVDECGMAMSTVLPNNKVNRQYRFGNFNPGENPSHVEVSSFSKAWCCLIPQHGPGKKHNRPIVLADWQLDLVSHWPGKLLRGLIHSDGCRFQNTGRGNWSCPRYGFNNRSADIRDIFCHACDLMGVHWTFSAPSTIYVSRKADVAKLDQFIGPKA